MVNAKARVALWWGLGLLAISASFLLPDRWETMTALAIVSGGMLLTRDYAFRAPGQRLQPRWLFAKQGSSTSLASRKGQARYILLLALPAVSAANHYHRPGLTLIIAAMAAAAARWVWLRGKPQS